MFQRGWNHQADGIILLSIILYTVIYNHNHGFACLKIGAQTHFSCKPMLKNPPFLCGAIESLLATPKMNYWWTSCTVDICDNWLLNIIDFVKKYIWMCRKHETVKTQRFPLKTQLDNAFCDTLVFNLGLVRHEKRCSKKSPRSSYTNWLVRKSGTPNFNG